MLDWATKRKLIYLGIIFGVIFFLVLVPIFVFFYDDPTCLDGVKNQGESGTDCGGPCSKLCSFEVETPKVLWSRSFKLSQGFYNAVALVENSNINAGTNLISYVFRLKNSDGTVLAERSGSTFIPNARGVVTIFEPDFRVGEEVVSTDFEFIGEAEWQKDGIPSPDIIVRNHLLSRGTSSPRLDAKIESQEIAKIPRLEVVAVIFDGSGTPIGSSRTFVNNLESGKVTDLVFTWPLPFEVKESICLAPLDLFLVFDRSGSMIFDNWDFTNPEPLTSSKKAALGFLDKLDFYSNVKIGLASFATEASLDIPLSLDIASVKKSVEEISIKAQTREEIFKEETNIAQGLELALDQITEDNLSGTEKVIVLFTDGAPTHPLKAGDKNYALNYTKEVAQKIKNEGINLFSIGLGIENIDEGFLREISKTPDHYFSASEVPDLIPIFNTILERVCKENPTTVEIFTRVSPAN